MKQHIKEKTKWKVITPDGYILAIVNQEDKERIVKEGNEGRRLVEVGERIINTHNIKVIEREQS